MPELDLPPENLEVLLAEQSDADQRRLVSRTYMDEARRLFGAAQSYWQDFRAMWRASGDEAESAAWLGEGFVGLNARSSLTAMPMRRAQAAGLLAS